MSAEKNKDTERMDTVRFVSLISMFAASAYQSMGKLANPLTGKVERNLEAARGFIDILIMLRNKTSGNLAEEEKKVLDSTISDLQLNFVQEQSKPEKPKAEDRDKKEEQPEKPGEKPEAKQEEPETKEEKQEKQAKETDKEGGGKGGKP